MAWDITSNLGSALVTTGGTDAPVSGTIETFIVSNAVNIPAAASATQTQFRVIDAAISTNPAVAEVILVTNVNGASWTVMRGAEAIGNNGASPVAHSSNWVATVIETAAGISNLLGLEPAKAYSLGLCGSVTVNLPAGYSVYNASLTAASTIFVLPKAQGGEKYMLWLYNTTTITAPSVVAYSGDTLTYPAGTVLWNVAASVINEINLTAASVGLVEAVATNSAPSPLQITLAATNQGGSDFNSNAWVELLNTSDNDAGLIIDYYQYDGATRLRYAPNRWASGGGFSLEYAPDENILIFGAVYGTGQYPVSTYFDGSNVLHLGAALATDTRGAIGIGGTTAGNFSWVMPFVGTGYKKLLINFSGYENDTGANQVYNLTTGGYGESYITGFVSPPNAVFNNCGLLVSLSGTTVTIGTPDSTQTYTGLVVFEGA